MEYLQHGDLQKYLNRSFPEAQVKDIASQLVEGLGYMHDNGFTHRDLKPAELFGYVVRGHAFPTSVLTEAGASQDCCKFVTKTMLADPSRRLTVREASAHPWVQSLLEEPVVDPEASQESARPDSLSNTGAVTPFEDTARWSTAMFSSIGQTAYQDQRSMAANPNHYPTQEMQPAENKTIQTTPNDLTNSVDRTQGHDLIGGLRNMNPNWQDHQCSTSKGTEFLQDARTSHRPHNSAVDLAPCFPGYHSNRLQFHQQ
ncbi:serine/threonine protein kinase [Ilyonectria robusta]